MTKEHAIKELVYRRDLLRERLAHQAAKLMAEDGITDYAHAKRKAAKQIGAGDTHHLPSNEEINIALHSFRTLFQSKIHSHLLRQLREEALATMQILAEFQPYLSGSVLNATAGEQSDINIMLFTDDTKAVVLFLLRHNIIFEDGEWKVLLGGRNQTVPSYTLISKSGIQTHLILLPENARFGGSRKPATHADITAVKALLAT